MPSLADTRHAGHSAAAMTSPQAPPPPHHDVDQVQQQLLQLRRSVSDLDYDQAHYSDVWDMHSDDDGKQDPLDADTSGSSPSDSANYSAASSPQQMRHTHLATPPAEQTDGDLELELADDLDDINALYNAIRAQKIVTHGHQRRSRELTSPLMHSPPLPSPVDIAAPPAEAEAVHEHETETTASSAIARIQRNMASMEERLAQAERDSSRKDEELRTLQALFDQAHADNLAKHQQLLQVESELDRAHTDLRARDAQLATTALSSSRTMREQTLEAQVRKLEQQLHGTRPQRLPSPVSDESSVPPAVAPSQIRAMNREFNEQLASQRTHYETHIRTLESRLANSSNKSSSSSSPAVDDVAVYKVHVQHLQSLLGQQLSSAHYAQTVTALSLKLSYWTVLRDVYEDTIAELSPPTARG